MVSKGFCFFLFKLLQVPQQHHVSQQRVESPLTHFLVDITAVQSGRCPARRRSSRGSSTRLLKKSTSKSLGGWRGRGGGRAELHLDHCKNNRVSASRIKPRQMPPRFGRARSTREPADPRLRRRQLGSSARRASQNFHGRKARDAVPSYAESDEKKEKLAKDEGLRLLPSASPTQAFV